MTAKRNTYYGLAVILFFCCQVLVDCFDSLTAFPFLHYGMFSGQFDNTSMETFEVKVNNKLLTADQFGILKWDLVHSPLVTYRKQVTTEDFAFDKATIKTGLQFAGMDKAFKMVKSNLNNNKEAFTGFSLWYKGYLAKLVNHEINSLEVTVMNYKYDKGNYILLNKEKWIKF